MDNRERAILKTLLYSNCFDYPLREEELYQFLINNQKIDKNVFYKLLQKVKKPISFNQGYYYLLGKEKFLKTRKQREKISLQKMQKAKNIISILGFIPTVQLIGISGALAMKNSDVDDDIDIFIISKNNFIWTTRFLTICLLILLGQYRNKNSKKYADKICLNMLLDEKNIQLEKNLYIAHEISQLVPVLERDNAYKKFIEQNKWVNQFMINALDSNKNNKFLKKKGNIIENQIINFLRLIHFEKITKFMQLKYMQSTITKEVVKDGVLRLHPFDYGAYVLKFYNEQLKTFNL